ncbi:MAG: hypothetical protein ACR2FE_08435 [Aeromicrobium sp.]
MNTQTTIAVLAMVFSVLSVFLSGWFSLRAARISHELEADRERHHEEESALKAAQGVYEPLAQAAAELQSRIFNIVETGWVGIVKRYESHGDYTETSTAFLVAHYFGWIEARRQAVLSSSGKGDRDEIVQGCIDKVVKTLRRSEVGEGFLFFAAEQRAIGELMFSWQPTRNVEMCEPHVMGYAAFDRRYREDPEFRRWFDPVGAGIARVSAGDNRRLIDIHHALVDLILALDPKHKYTAGYALQPIEIDIGAAPPPIAPHGVAHQMKDA